MARRRPRENQHGHAFRLGVQAARTDLVGTWTADAPVAERYEVDHRVTTDAAGVCTRRNVLRRRVLDGAGAVVGDELVATNEARVMYPISKAP